MTTLPLEAHIWEDQGGWKPTLFDAVTSSILQSTYIDTKASGSLSAVIYSDAAKARTTIDELSEGNLGGTRQSRLDWLRNDALGKQIRPLAFYHDHMRVLSSMSRALDDCEILRSKLQSDQQVDSDLIRRDISFLITYG